MASSVDNLAELWASLDALLASLDDAAWRTPTGCPGWTVQDQVSHLVDYESRPVGDTRPEHTVPDLPHLRNEMGRHNEVGVDLRRPRRPAEVLAEYRDVMARRLAQLRGLSDADLERPMTTPAGPGTLQTMLTLRVMDTWSHEQDIRRATGRPGHLDGPAVDESLAYFSTLLPYVVGKRAAAPEGSTAVFRVGERAPLIIEVSGGRARRTDAVPDAPTVELAMPVATFGA
ncbi:MAG: maleylpyruvate isomerase family mycothiol-dependent enzyme, partial [Chloroflexi bacterium]